MGEYVHGKNPNYMLGRTLCIAPAAKTVLRVHARDRTLENMCQQNRLEKIPRKSTLPVGGLPLFYNMLLAVFTRKITSHKVQFVNHHLFRLSSLLPRTDGGRLRATDQTADKKRVGRYEREHCHACRLGWGRTVQERGLQRFLPALEVQTPI